MEKGRKKDLYLKESVAFTERDMMMMIVCLSVTQCIGFTEFGQTETILQKESISYSYHTKPSGQIMMTMLFEGIPSTEPFEEIPSIEAFEGIYSCSLSVKL